MKEIVTIFGCLSFITVGLFTPAYAASIIPSALTGNDLILFIALLVVFFLLGLILGLLIGSNGKDRENKPIQEEQMDRPQEANSLGQDYIQTDYHQEDLPFPTDFNSRYYKNYW